MSTGSSQEHPGVQAAPSASAAPSPGSQVPKVVTISEEPEQIDPSQHVPPPSYSPRLHRASISGRKMTGRPSVDVQSRQPSLSHSISYLKLDEAESPPLTRGDTALTGSDARGLFAQVTEWLASERQKRTRHPPGELGPQRLASHPDEAAQRTSQSRHGDADLALDELERILANFGASALLPDKKASRRTSIANVRRSALAKYHKKADKPSASSDTEWIEGDIHVPHVEASLDNTKTLAYAGGEASIESGDHASSHNEQKHWDQFKQDIVRLTHTLKIRGWRRIPIDHAAVIHVERLSGALTNAVYVVKPPKQLPPITARPDGTMPYVPASTPLELLLRVYGPQVDHLIDRDTELNILRRLAQKKIGPRLLGYFTNGRFEEYLHAKTLGPQDLRVPDTSKQIAKRMRELHDGIELLPSERSGGPRAFLNWDKWVDRCEKVITWLDQQVLLEQRGLPPASPRYTRRGLICGVEWPVFRRTFQKYRAHLHAHYRGVSQLKERLVFAHNDTQYGNLMRLEPPGNSPLVQPANQHRQLVVIDFEYASANTPGYEFANHFTEWCYNYHHASSSYACNTQHYPTPAEQERFLRAYVMHRPQYAPAASMTPKLDGREKTNISDFMLDARTPGGGPSIDYDEAEREREKKVEDDIEYLLFETKLWRIENSAQWVAWGLVQAKVPELDEPAKQSRSREFLQKIREQMHIHSDPLDADVRALQEAATADRPESRAQEEAHHEGDGEEEAEDFDYLGYAQDRAMFFWGDCLQMGLVKEDELPPSLLEQVKYVKL